MRRMAPFSEYPDVVNPKSFPLTLTITLSLFIFILRTLLEININFVNVPDCIIAKMHFAKTNCLNFTIKSIPFVKIQFQSFLKVSRIQGDFHLSFFLLALLF